MQFTKSCPPACSSASSFFLRFRLSPAIAVPSVCARVCVCLCFSAKNRERIIEIARARRDCENPPRTMENLSEEKHAKVAVIVVLCYTEHVDIGTSAYHLDNWINVHLLRDGRYFELWTSRRTVEHEKKFRCNETSSSFSNTADENFGKSVFVETFEFERCESRSFMV